MMAPESDRASGCGRDEAPGTESEALVCEGQRPLGSPRHFAWLRGVVAMVLWLNLLDGMLTLYWIFSEQAVEANPFMAELILLHPVLFILGKLALVSLGSCLLWRMRRRRLAVIAIFMVFLVYYWILLYHLQAMNLGLIRRWLG